MKQNTLLVLIILALIAINVFTLLKFNKLKQQKNNKNLVNNFQDNVKAEELNAFKASFKTNLKNSGLPLNEISIKDSLNNANPLKKVFDNTQKQMLVFRFSKRHCESCVVASMEVLQKWIGLIGDKNILILGNYKNNKIFQRTMKEYGIKYPNVYNSESFDIPAEELGYPYFFVLNRNLEISNVFVPDKGLSKITTEYLKGIHKRFENSK